MGVDGGWRQAARVAANSPISLQVVAVRLQAGKRMPGQVHHIEPVQKALDTGALVLIGLLGHQDPVGDRAWL